MHAGKRFFLIFSVIAGISLEAISLLIPGLARLELGGWFVWFHAALEIFTIIVGFFVGGYSLAYSRQTHLRRYFILGLVFISAAVLDFIHVLVFPGMPSSVLFPSANLAIYFYMAARLLTVLGILSAFFFVAKIKRNGVATGILSALVVVVSLYMIASLAGPNLPLFLTVSGLLPDKIVTEYIIAGFFILCGVLFWKDYRNNMPEKRIQSRTFLQLEFR